jgi:hypothetical protein
MIKKINYEGRDLTKKETIQIQYLWQSFNPKNSKMLDDGYIVIDQAHIDQYSKSSTFDFKNSLDYYQESDYRCKKYTCDYKRTGLQITYKDNKLPENHYLYRQIENAEIKPSEQCVQKDYKCTITMSLIAEYNCAGWALGISKTLKLSHDFENEIPLLYLKYKDTNSVFGQFAKNSEVQYSLPNPIPNNTIALYFNQGIWKHASRFITSIDGIEINQWTSKAGYSIIYTHDDIPTDSLYGNKIVYLVPTVGLNELSDYEEIIPSHTNWPL